MTARNLLPPHGTMTAEQLYGFRVACACMSTWGRQLASGGGQMAPHGRFMDAAARTLDITLGQGAVPAPAPSLAPQGWTELS